MSLNLFDRVKETCSAPGTGTVTLLGAVTGYQSFSVIGNGNTCYYTIADQYGANWEVGIGTYTLSGTTLARTTVLSSSAGGTTKANFSSGIQDVFVTYPAEKSFSLDMTLGVSNGGTGLTSLTAGYIPYGNGTGAFSSSGNLVYSTDLTLTGGNYLCSAGKGIAYLGDATRIFTPEDNVSGGLLQWGSGGILRFKSGASTEFARFDSSGNLLVGTTSGSTYSAGGKFYSLPTGTTNPTGISTGCWASIGNAINFFSGVGTGVAYAGAITLNGSITLYTSASDRRLKANIVPITGTDSGSIIDALKPCSFAMISNGAVAKGFIADEFQTVFSKSVHGTPNEIDKNGNAVYQSIDSSSPEMIATIVAELKSLRSRLKAANIA